MKKFIVTYHAPASMTEQAMSLSPEDQAKGMQAWMDWAQRCGQNLTDMGAPLMNGQVLGMGGTRSSSKKELTGYSILEAENLESAVELLAGHPHLGWHPDASIEVHETMPLPGTM